MKRLLVILLLLSSIIFKGSGWAVIPDPIPCFKDLQINFFRESLVYQSLSLYKIPQGLWEPISKTLRMKSYQVPERMRRVTANMVPNPIEYPMQREETAKILKKVLMDIFYETMTKYQVNERPTADFIFDYIFKNQLQLFINCFGEEARKLATPFD